jgi:hypothetical protein
MLLTDPSRTTTRPALTQFCTPTISSWSPFGIRQLPKPGVFRPYLWTCNFETNMLTQTLGVPFLFFCEDDTAANESPPNDDRLSVFNHMVTNAYWLKLKSTDHGCFSDWDLILDSASLQSVFGTPVSGQLLPPARVSQIVRAYVLSFFKKFLLGEDDHLLDGPSLAYPEVEQFMKK